MQRLAAVDLDARMSRKEEAQALERAWNRLKMLRLKLGGQLDGQLGPPLCVVFEGWDAAGKGGCIRRLVYPLDPRHYTVHSIAAPTEREKRHHFLWRFWPSLPGHGGMVVFDRSWYGRVLVERVEGFATETEWRRSYREIEEFERMLTEEGTILVKFWLHISAEEQANRFERRQVDPTKQWKLTDEDWRNRDKRSAYVDAIEEMLLLTDSAHSPWHVVSAESKRNARVTTCQLTIDAVERGLIAQGFDLPPELDVDDDD